MMAIFIPAWLSSSVLWSERQESYALLRTLPVTDREIVRAKSGLVLAAALAYWAILSLFVLSIQESPQEYSAYAALTNLACALALPLAACWYIYSWRFGPNALTVGGLVFLVLDVIAAFVINIDNRRWTGALGIAAARWLAEVPWYFQFAMFLVALASYYMLMEVAVPVKAKSEACL